MLGKTPGRPSKTKASIKSVDEVVCIDTDDIKAQLQQSKNNATDQVL